MDLAMARQSIGPSHSQSVGANGAAIQSRASERNRIVGRDEPTEDYEYMDELRDNLDELPFSSMMDSASGMASSNGMRIYSSEAESMQTLDLRRNSQVSR